MTAAPTIEQTNPFREVTIGRALAALTQFRYPKLFVEGPRGTSKSRGILTVLLIRLLRYPGSRLILCRRFRSDLTKTILMTLELEVFPAFGMKIPGGANREGRSEYALENGSLILPVGIDQGTGALSMGATFAYVAEAIEMTQEQVTDVAGALRWMQSPENPKLPTYTQMIVDGNPGAPGHWVNKIAEPVSDVLRLVRSREDYARLQAHNFAPAADPVRRWKRIVTRHQDNPGYWNHDAWDYTPLGRQYVTEQLEGYTGFKRARWLDGLWQAAEGSVFPEFSEARNVCAPFPNGWPESWPVFVGYDSGYDHPAAVVFYGIAPTGQPHIFNRIHQSGLTLEDLGGRIVQRARGLRVVSWLADPRDVFKKTAHASGKSIADFMRERFGLHFLPWPPKAKDEVQNQVEAVRELIRGELPLQVWSTCPEVISEFQSWAYKRMADGSMPAGDDAYEDRNNHAMDAILGIVATNPTFAPLAFAFDSPRE